MSRFRDRPDCSEDAELTCYSEHHLPGAMEPRSKFGPGGPDWRGGAALHCRACKAKERRMKYQRRGGPKAPKGPANVGGMSRDRLEAALREFQKPIQTRLAL